MNTSDNNDIKDFAHKSSNVELRGVSKLFPSHDSGTETIAVNNIDLEIKEGELVTLLGPSGCGKTTTLRMISGFEYPSGGDILIGGESVLNVPPNKRNISMVFQSYALFPHLTIRENISYGLKVHKLPKNEIREKAGKAVELMQLQGMENRFPNQLSGGQQQRVALARAIVIEPKVLLFDEPLSNLDAKLREHMRDELRALQKRLGITSLYVTHDQSEAMAISDRIVIMNNGNISQMGTPQDIYDYPRSQFIANFIGKANFIIGEFKERSSLGSVVMVGNTPLTVTNPGDVDLIPGQKCCISARPETISLSPDGDGIPGKVVRATYFGTKIEYEVQLPENTLVVEIYNPQRSKIFHEGDTVKAVLALDCVRVLGLDSDM